MSSSSKAFSLIELLIVVVIITVIALIGGGVVSSLQRGADDAKCVANMRVAGQAMLSYFHDRNGWFFPGKKWFHYPSTKPEPNSGMRDYFGVTQMTYNINDLSLQYDTVLTCPAMKKKYSGLYPQALNRGHAINEMLYTKDPSSSYDSVPADEHPMLPGGLYRISNVKNPARMWILSDSAVNGGLWLWGSIRKEVAEAGDGKYLPMPHRGETQNIIFMDGHVERITRQEFGSPRNKRDFWGDTTIPPEP